MKNNWKNVKDELPPYNETVWLTNEDKNWVALGCLVNTKDGIFWGHTNGEIYKENGKIVTECEFEDLDVHYWHEVPTLNF